MVIQLESIPPTTGREVGVHPGQVSLTKANTERQATSCTHSWITQQELFAIIYGRYSKMSCRGTSDPLYDSICV